MRPGILVRLALAGTRTDHLRTTLTAASSALAALAMFAAATVLTIRGGEAYVAPDGTYLRTSGAQRYSSPYLHEAGLRPGVAAVFVVLSLLVLVLAGQCIRLGAPARDRRLAAIRLAGATPRQAVLIASAETVSAAVLGSVAGLGVYLLLRMLLERRNAAGLLALPTDVLPPALTMIGLLLVVPAVAGLAGAFLLRRVVISPLGVTRRTRSRGPLPWPGIVIGAGLLFFQMPGWVGLTIGGKPFVALLVIGALLCVIGVVLGAGWITYATGQMLRRFGGRPAMLLAGKRLIADPWSGSRTFAALLASVVVGAAALGVRAGFVAMFDARSPLEGGPAADEGFYTGGVDLFLIAVAIGVVISAVGTLIALAEGIVARRRAYATLTAVGVPAKTLAEAVLWQVLAPLVPALLVAMVTGFAASEFFNKGGSLAEGDVDVPLGALSLLGGGTLLMMLVAAGTGLLVLRSSTDLDELRAG
ncbi:FtsX-like permease family protein [Actinoplanes sp. RD1]|uniref:FtsX-like permease family protein n=1 Tax=Actinoplanes sp. RD1 TaxID=3064538 RepID=UPI00274063DD|nr:FtsX-like permease family protein [Actinoplanes sp. RD1]